MQTFTRWKRKSVVDLIAQTTKEERDTFFELGYTIGGMMIFPAGKGQTINQRRGCLTTIADRMDLTLECIRKHYLGASNPLKEVLTAYAPFFEVFGRGAEGFDQYVSHFLLDDLVADGRVRFFFRTFTRDLRLRCQEGLDTPYLWQRRRRSAAKRSRGVG
jgi:hypothetical protein